MVCSEQSLYDRFGTHPTKIRVAPTSRFARTLRRANLSRLSNTFWRCGVRQQRSRFTLVTQSLQSASPLHRVLTTHTAKIDTLCSIVQHRTDSPPPPLLYILTRAAGGRSRASLPGTIGDCHHVWSSRLWSRCPYVKGGWVGLVVVISVVVIDRQMLRNRPAC